MQQYEYEIHSADENVCGADETIKGEQRMEVEQRGIGVVARFFEAFATLEAEHSILEVVRR